MIAIIDYGMGNIRSAQRGLEHVGAEVRIVHSPDEIELASAIVVPGDGAFGKAMDNLRAASWIEPLDDWVTRGKPLLGICVGMQLLFETSEEMGMHQGLGILQGSVRRFPDGLKIPQMGWNQIDLQQMNPLLTQVPDGGYVYFVHSYYCCPSDTSINLATTDYGIEFASIVARDNVWGVQFHPEKSQKVGLIILENFVSITR